MKKVIALVLILLSYASSYGQLTDFHLRIGASASHSLVHKNTYFLSSSSDPFSHYTIKKSFAFGKTIGGGFSYALSKKNQVYIQTDINYAERGLNIKSNRIFATTGTKEYNNPQYNYLDATILLKQYNHFGNFKFGYGLGGTFAYFIGSKFKSNDVYGPSPGAPIDPDIFYRKQQEKVINANNRKFDFAISGEFSLDYDISSKTSLGLNLRFNRSLFYSTKKVSPYQYSLQNANNPTPEDVGIASRNLLLSFVYKYRIPEKSVKTN